ncbi:AMP-binding protein [Rhizobium setariae]|nr:AMP-binding protein [Rhizobium setariae]
MPEWRTPDPVALYAQAQPEKLACVDLATGRQWNYRQFNGAIQRTVSALASLGVEPGQRIAAIARNSADLLMLQQAAMRSGAIFVPINWRLSRPEQADILAGCAPSLLVTDEDIAGMILPRGCKDIAVAEFREAVARETPAAAQPLPPADAPNIILYTSGTSGRPKGVVITGRNVFATAVNFGVLGQVGQGSVFLCDTPMFHIIGLITSMHSPLLQGGTVLVSSAFDPMTTNARLADAAFGVTHYFCVPQMAQALRGAANFAPENWRSLKALFTGGAPNPPANIRWWLGKGVRMVDGYGMTEAGTLLGMPLDPALIDAKAGSAGLPAPGLTMRIVDEAGMDVGAGEVGEILVAGPNVTPGYWARPEETAKAFTPDGWLKTGDLARRDEDGFVTIVDRRKDMFISGGENVYPVEVEAALNAHPSILDAAVIGVADEKWGEVGRAFIVLRPGCAVASEALVAHCAGLIARYKIPRDYVRIENLPRSGAGKVLKNELKRLGLSSATTP